VVGEAALEHASDARAAPRDVSVLKAGADSKNIKQIIIGAIGKGEGERGSVLETDVEVLDLALVHLVEELLIRTSAALVDLDLVRSGLVAADNPRKNSISTRLNGQSCT